MQVDNQSLSGLINIGQNSSISSTPKQYIKLKKDALILEEGRKGKLNLVEIGEKVLKVFTEEKVFEKLIPSDLINIKKGMDKLKNKLQTYQKNNKIKTFFLNIFTGGRYGKSTQVYEKIIDVIDTRIDLLNKKNPFKATNTLNPETTNKTVQAKKQSTTNQAKKTKASRKNKNHPYSFNN